MFYISFVLIKDDRRHNTFGSCLNREYFLLTLLHWCWFTAEQWVTHLPAGCCLTVIQVWDNLQVCYLTSVLSSVSDLSLGSFRTNSRHSLTVHVMFQSSYLWEQHWTSVNCLQHCAALARVRYELLMGAVWFYPTAHSGEAGRSMEPEPRRHLGPDWWTWRSEVWVGSDVMCEVLQTIFLTCFKTWNVTLCVLMPLKRIMEMWRGNVWWRLWLFLLVTKVEKCSAVRRRRRDRLSAPEQPSDTYSRATSRFCYYAIILV